MSVVQCANGHYYNPEVHSACPYCTEEFGYPPVTEDDWWNDDPTGRGGADYPSDNILTPPQPYEEGQDKKEDRQAT